MWTESIWFRLEQRIGFSKDENSHECLPYRASCSVGHKCWVTYGVRKTNFGASQHARCFLLTGSLTCFLHCRVCCLLRLFGRPEVNKLFRRPRRRWEDNIKTDLKSNVTELLIRLILFMTSGVRCGEPSSFIKDG